MVSVLAVIVAGGCGGGSGTVSSRATLSAYADQISPSMGCRSASPQGAPGSCTVVLSSGLRYRCSLRFAQHLAPGLTPVSMFERTKACTRLSRLVIPLALRPTAERIGKARACLSAHHIRVLGGLDFPLHGESYSPAGELDASPQGTGSTPGGVIHGVGLPGDVLIAFYRNTRSAERAAPRVLANVNRVNTKHSGAEFERAGSDSLVWLARPPLKVRGIVEACTR